MYTMRIAAVVMSIVIALLFLWWIVDYVRRRMRPPR
jgi:uncharacterized membrane-anchored protein